MPRQITVSAASGNTRRTSSGTSATAASSVSGRRGPGMPVWKIGSTQISNQASSSRLATSSQSIGRLAPMTRRTTLASTSRA
jgi:hypothetical protein